MVSSSGTALTEGQIGMLKRYTQNITLLFDGDAAGLRASFRGLDMMLEQGVNVRVVSFPEGEDPDSFAKQKTNEELEEFLKSSKKDFISFKTTVLLQEAAGDPLKIAQMVRDVVGSISKVPDQIGREVLIKEAASILEMEPNALYEELGDYRVFRKGKEGKTKLKRLQWKWCQSTILLIKRFTVMNRRRR